MLCAELVTVRWSDRTGRPHKATALLEDISTSGACLQFETAVPVGSSLRFSSGKRALDGRAIYCVYREIGYFVGVQLNADSKWSKRDFTPEHMLDLQRLLRRAIRAAARRTAAGVTVIQ